MSSNCVGRYLVTVDKNGVATCANVHDTRMFAKADRKGKSEPFDITLRIDPEADPAICLTLVRDLNGSIIWVKPGETFSTVDDSTLAEHRHVIVHSELA